MLAKLAMYTQINPFDLLNKFVEHMTLSTLELESFIALDDAA